MWARKRAETWVDPYAVELKRRERWGDRWAAALGVAVALLFILWISYTDVWLACEMRQHVAGGCYERCGPPYFEQGLQEFGSMMCF